MKIKRTLVLIMVFTVLTSILSTSGLLVSAAENPYSYSNEPTRAIYYTLPTMKGNDVKWVQAALNAFGNYGLALDGSFGPACREATLKFQAASGLAQDGSFGPATRAQMVSWLSQNGYTSGGNSNPASGSADNPYNYSSKPTRAIYYTLPTMKGNDVKWVQAALNAFGSYGLALDGSFGPACREATLKFQAANGLAQDGSFGPATRAQMVSWLSQKGYASGNSTSGNTVTEPTYNLCWPLPSRYKNITSGVGPRNISVPGASKDHKGIDISADAGTSVYAVYDGVVTGVGSTSARGNYVAVYHSAIGLTSIYQHLSSYSVSYGQTISKGQTIGGAGNTGVSGGVHLHLELVQTASQSQSHVDSAYIYGAQLVDGSYTNPQISYTYIN